ncbi:MAG: glycosyltransferase family 4 protein [Pseudoxanthomonas suwonensis]|nr:glycosyltransferase family 4 protein [Pseudoxanthomonas suwonensis]
MTGTPLHVAHVMLTRRFAGTERHVVELANAQAAAGHRVSLILRRDGAMPKPDGIRQHVHENVAVVVVPNLLRGWHARRALQRLQPDIAHAHLTAARTALRGWRTTIPRLATLHIEYKPQQHADLDGLIAIAPWQFEAMPPAQRARSVHIDNWTLPRSPTLGARAQLRQAHGIAADAFVFGALGRVEDSKGLDVLVEAWKRAALPADARLVIVGQGKAWERLRQAAPADVVMPGFTEVARDWLEVFDVFVSAARSEPFGLVLLEAMHAGLPVIASASQGATHLQSVIGTPLLPVGDADALAKRLRDVFDARPSRHGYDLERFTIEPKLAEIEAFYRRLLAGRETRS